MFLLQGWIAELGPDLVGLLAVVVPLPVVQVACASLLEHPVWEKAGQPAPRFGVLTYELHVLEVSHGWRR